MRQRSSGPFRAFAFTVLSLLLFSAHFVLATPSVAQTTQPFLFAETYDSNGNNTGFVTLLHDSPTGALSMLDDSTVPFQDSCVPSAIDPTGRFLFGARDTGLAMYTLDQTTGVIS